MDDRSLLALFGKLHVWRAHGHRAPHKPLLVLWAIGRCLRGEPRMAPYSELAEPLGDLLREFGPPRKAVHPSFPFWRLRADGVWALDGAAEVTVTKSGDAHESALRAYVGEVEHGIRGSGTPNPVKGNARRSAATIGQPVTSIEGGSGGRDVPVVP